MIYLNESSSLSSTESLLFSMQDFARLSNLLRVQKPPASGDHKMESLRFREIRAKLAQLSD